MNDYLDLIYFVLVLAAFGFFFWLGRRSVARQQKSRARRAQAVRQTEATAHITPRIMRPGFQPDAASRVQAKRLPPEETQEEPLVSPMLKAEAASASAAELAKESAARLEQLKIANRKTMDRSLAAMKPVRSLRPDERDYPANN